MDGVVSNLSGMRRLGEWLDEWKEMRLQILSTINIAIRQFSPNSYKLLGNVQRAINVL